MAADEHVCMNIVVGCYERTILGYELIEKVKRNEFEIRPRFTDNSHIGCVKAVATSRTHLASGSTDETVHLYNLATNTDVGSLMQHDGSVTSLVFIGDTHLMSAGNDGLLCVWSTNNWDCQKVMRGHKDAINSLAVHPSGKLALTVSKDKTLKTWNLVNGRPAYTTHIKEVADAVLWSPDGAIYLVIINNIINIYSVTTATVICSIDHGSTIHTANFIEERVIAVGGEGPDIVFYKLKLSSAKLVGKFEAHEKRVKAIHCSKDFSSNTKPTVRWLVSVSSDGFIKLWEIVLNDLSTKPRLLTYVGTTARLTCVTVQELDTEETADDNSKPDKRKSSIEKKGEKKKKMK